MSDTHFDVIVLGAGPGGYLAAERLGHAGKKVALVEEQYLGGTCLNVGCIPTKTLLNGAKNYLHAKEASQFGVDAEGVAAVRRRLGPDPLRPDAEERLVVAGTANLARSTPDFSSLGPLLDAIEEQVVLLRLFTDDAPAGENRMRVSIGSENNDDALAEASVVTTTYGPGTGEAVAHLGVIGPTRMDYPATMTDVRAVARYLSRFLSPPET